MERVISRVAVFLLDVKGLEFTGQFLADINAPAFAVFRPVTSQIWVVRDCAFLGFIAIVFQKDRGDFFKVLLFHKK